MYTRWTQHLSEDEDKKAFEREVRGCKLVLDRLLTMLNEDLNALDRSEQDQRIYTIPNWDYIQAHKNGIRQEINVIKRIIDLDQQRGTTNDPRLTGEE